MIFFQDFKFSNIPDYYLNEMYKLRKSTFKDRLNWDVTCIGDKEFDEYDNDNTIYLLGRVSGLIICSLRFIEMKHPTMVKGPFSPFFKTKKLPSNRYIESSRFFIDKERSKNLCLSPNTLRLLFFLCMINYSIAKNYAGIITIVSRSMLILLKRSSWPLAIIEKSLSEKNDDIYLLHLKVDIKSQSILLKK